MIRAVGGAGVQEPVYNIDAVFRQKRKDGIEALLQMPVRKDQIMKESRIGAGSLVPPHRLPRGFPAQLFHLVEHLRPALGESRAERVIEPLQFCFQAAEKTLYLARCLLKRPLQGFGNQRVGKLLLESLLVDERLLQGKLIAIQ